MEEKIKIIPKGHVFTISEGEYSDYQTLTVCRAFLDINVKILEIGFHQKCEREKVYPTSERFLHWLINEKRYAEELHFSELHIGDYELADFRLWERAN